MASHSGRAKVLNRNLITITNRTPISVENIELLTNTTLVIPGLRDIQLENYAGRLRSRRRNQSWGK
jgi:hypothetical protein